MTVHVFAGANYYPGGGMEDYRGSAETIQEGLDLAPHEEWVQVATEDEGILKLVGTWYRHPSWTRKNGLPGPWIESEKFQVANPEQTP